MRSMKLYLVSISLFCLSAFVSGVPFLDVPESKLQKILSYCPTREGVGSDSDEQVVVYIKVPSFMVDQITSIDWLNKLEQTSPSNLFVERRINWNNLSRHAKEVLQFHLRNKPRSNQVYSNLTELDLWSNYTTYFCFRIESTGLYVLRPDHYESSSDRDIATASWYKIKEENFSAEALRSIRQRAIMPFMSKYPNSKITEQELRDVLTCSTGLARDGEDLLILRATWEEGEVSPYIWNTLPPHMQYAWYRVNQFLIKPETIEKLKKTVEVSMEHSSRRTSLRDAGKKVATLTTVVSAFQAGSKPQTPSEVAATSTARAPRRSLKSVVGLFSRTPVHPS